MPPWCELHRADVDTFGRDDITRLVPGEPLPFGLHATALDAVAPVYLQGFYPRSRYSVFRYYAGRKAREV